MRLANKIAIITGGGSGIGRASAYLFAREGAKVVVAERTFSTGEETAAIINSSGGEAIFVCTNVQVASEIEHLVKVTKDKFGKIDILFNNAGVLIGPTAVEDIEETGWDHTYAVNVKSIFLGVKYVVPEMKKAGGGVIINTASIGGVRPIRVYFSAYNSSKGAVIVLTKALAIELAPHNIRVNCLNPGSTDTPMMWQSLPDGVNWDEFKKELESRIPLGRMTKPEDVAYAALYLASDEASMVTAVSLGVDGGRGI